jgi:acetyl esterase/lipase
VPVRLPLLALLLIGSRLAADVPGPSGLVYARPGGRPLLLDAYVPPGSGPFPAVILVHGGGWVMGTRHGDVRPFFTPLLEAQIAAFAIDYRLAPENKYPACVEDVQSAIRWVKRHAGQFKVDPSRVALLGESAGGYLVEMAAVRADPDTQVTAVVSLYGACDLAAEARWRGGLSRGFIGLFGRKALDPQTEAMLRAASPVEYVHAGLPPFLLVHGTADRIVRYEQSLLFLERLRSAGDRCELITIKGGAHAMGGWLRIDPNYKQEIVGWLSRQLSAGQTVIASAAEKANIGR